MNRTDSRRTRGSALLVAGLMTLGADRAFAQWSWLGSCGGTDWYQSCVADDACGPNTDGCLNNWFASPGCGVGCPLPFPGASDSVTIAAGGGVTLGSIGATIASLDCQRPFTLAGTLTVNGSATFSDLVVWNSDGMLGAGTTTITSTGVLRIAGPNTKTLQQRAVLNEGAAIWSGTGTFDLSNGAVFENSDSFSVEGDAVMSFTFGNPAVFSNDGSFIKQNSFGETLIQGVVFNNAGSLTLASGSLRLATGGTSTGAFVLGAGTTLEMNNAYTFASGAAVTGNGILLINGGTLTLAADVSAVNTTLAAGSMVGPGNYTSAETLRWTEGTMAGPGQTSAADALIFSGPGVKTADGRGLTAFDTIWEDDGTIDFINGTTFENEFYFEIKGNGILKHSLGAPATLFNLGSVVKSAGSGVTLVQDVVFNNSSDVSVDVGTLRLATTGASSGEFAISANAVLEMSAGSHTFFAGTDVIGEGTLKLSGATLTVAADVNAENVALSAGSVTGSGTFACNQSFAWTGGSMTGTGATVIGLAAVGSAAGAGLKTLDARALTVTGTLNWLDTGSLDLKNGATLWNAGGLTVAHGNATLTHSGGAAATFDNSGTFRKQTGVGVTLVQDVVFNNSGLVDVSSGTLRLATTGQSRGRYALSPGTNLEMSSGSHTFNDGADVAGAGTLKLNGAALTVAAVVHADNVVLSAGSILGAGTFFCDDTLVWTGGPMTGGGETYNKGEATISGAGLKTLSGRTFTNDLLTAWTGTGNLSLDSGAKIQNLAFFYAKNDATVLHAFGAATVFDNAGTFTKSDSNGVTLVQGVNFNNTGTVDVQSGTLRFATTLTNSASFTVAQGATVELSSGNQTFNAGATVTGAGTLKLSGATLNIPADVSAWNVNISSGNLTGAGTFGCESNLTWSSGLMSGTGQTLINPGATGTLSGGFLKSLSSRTLTNQGTMIWLDLGNLDFSNGATLNNNGTFEVRNDATLNQSSGTPGTLNNTGTVRKTGSVGQTTFAGVPITNFGQVLIDSGVLRLFSNYTQNSGATKISGGATLNSNQPIKIQGGDLSGNGGVSGNLQNSGGTVKPGQSPGTLTITGSYIQSVTAALSIELGGHTPGAEHDVLVVNGPATLGGTLELRLMDGFVPQDGDSFQILTASAVTGSFPAVQLVGFPPRLAVNVAYTSNSVVVTVERDEPGPRSSSAGVAPQSESATPPP
ncbi:MAG: hypothetical protein CHACPFDD_01147 [Phycisphaerae bacterium]|nr:hypothetical protein [Phycisphaerae bacterium]